MRGDESRWNDETFENLLGTWNFCCIKSNCENSISILYAKRENKVVENFSLFFTFPCELHGAIV